jgi:hypothetical protein
MVQARSVKALYASFFAGFIHHVFAGADNDARMDIMDLKPPDSMASSSSSSVGAKSHILN